MIVVPIAFVVAVLTGVLGLAAVVKLRAASSGRAIVVGAGELAFAIGCCAVSLSEAAFGLAIAFAAFAIVHVRRDRDADCGCFGDDAPGSGGTGDARSRARLTAGSALLSAGAGGLALTRTGTGLRSSIAGLAVGHPLAGLGVGAVALVAALGWRAAFVRRPARASGLGDRLVTSSALFLERRLTRRTVLLRVALGGSALAVAPLRYLLYPGDAMAAITPSDCSTGLCTDGYTAFCCEINQGGNTCPEGTFPGGWWMCTDYTGRQLCAEQGVRYYVDCNALPGHPFHTGCVCANGNCDERRVACNVFRYGQCNTQIPGVTAVVCRMILCENPSRVSELHCSASVAVDDATCGHEAPCLRAPARELVGAGGV